MEVADILRAARDAVSTAEIPDELKGVAFAKAVDLVSALKPDVVLMDLEMPRMGGIEATRLIKGTSPETRVIILTMHDEPLPARSASDVGAYAYVIKGTSPQLIRDVVLKAGEHAEGAQGPRAGSSTNSG